MTYCGLIALGLYQFLLFLYQAHILQFRLRLLRDIVHVDSDSRLTEVLVELCIYCDKSIVQIKLI